MSDQTIEFPQIVSTLDGAYIEALNLSMGTGILLSAVRQIASDLDREQIDYTLIDAPALNLHGYSRLTTDIDLVMSEQGLERFRERLLGRGHRLNFEGASRSFRTSAENMAVEVRTAGEYPGDGLPKPVSFPDPKSDYVVIEGVKTLSLEKLVDLKLASGMTAADRLKDLAGGENRNLFDYISERVEIVKKRNGSFTITTQERVIKEVKGRVTTEKNNTYTTADVSKLLTALRKKFPLPA